MSRKTTYTEQLDRFFEVYFQELRSMSDKEVLDGEDPKIVRERARARIERAAAEAGRRRLAAAKREFKSAASPRRGALPDIAPAVARAYIAKIASSRLGLYTLAARNLDEISDEDLLQLYQQIIELEAKHAKKEP